MENANKNSAAIRLCAAVLFSSALCGCADRQFVFNGDHKKCPPIYGTPGCHGFHATCWQKWPDECGPCPSPFEPPMAPIVAPGPETNMRPPMGTSDSFDHALDDHQPAPPAVIDPTPIPAVEPADLQAPTPNELPELQPMQEPE